MRPNEEPQVLEPAVSTAAPPKDAVKVPDATGMAMRDAIRTISAAGLVPQVEGTGKLVRQAPLPGAAAAKGAGVRLSFEPSS
jgi:beta-lactam-binding protein with PASTA domain